MSFVWFIVWTAVTCSRIFIFNISNVIISRRAVENNELFILILCLFLSFSLPVSPPNRFGDGETQTCTRPRRGGCYYTSTLRRDARACSPRRYKEKEKRKTFDSKKSKNIYIYISGNFFARQPPCVCVCGEYWHNIIFIRVHKSARHRSVASSWMESKYSARDSFHARTRLYGITTSARDKKILKINKQIYDLTRIPSQNQVLTRYFGARTEQWCLIEIHNNNIITMFQM